MSDKLAASLGIVFVVGFFVVLGITMEKRAAYVQAERSRLMAMCMSDIGSEFECYKETDSMHIR